MQTDTTTKHEPEGRKVLQLGKRKEKVVTDNPKIKRKPTRTLSQEASHGVGTKAATQQAQKTPPPSLIETWVWMWQSGPTPDVKRQGKSRLLSAFGSIQAVITYIEKSTK